MLIMSCFLSSIKVSFQHDLTSLIGFKFANPTFYFYPTMLPYVSNLPCAFYGPQRTLGVEIIICVRAVGCIEYILCRNDSRVRKCRSFFFLMF